MIRKKALLFALLLMAVAMCGFAQDSNDDSGEDWYVGKIISAINFEGLRSVKKTELAGVVNRYIGKRFSDSTYGEIVDTLYSLGYFSEIEPFAKRDNHSPDKMVLVFTVKEHSTVASFSFKGNRKIRNNELKDNTTIKVGDIYMESAVLVDERAIRDLYIKKGFTGAKVTHTSEDTGDGVRVVFHITEGRGTVVTSIGFSGNTVFTSRTLKSKMTLKEEGFAKNGAYQESALEQDKQAIINHYMTKGYMDAKVVDVIINESKNEKKSRDEVQLVFIIQEGEPYMYNGLTIEGNSIFNTERLMGLVKLKVGDVYNHTKFVEGISAITNLYYENGYMSNDFRPEVDKDGERHTVAYALTIIEKSRAHIESIIVKGNTKTKDYVIKREIPLKPGDVFSRDKVMAGLRNLYNTQYFSSIVPEPVPGSEENLVNLVVTVEEQSTTSLQLGMTFSGISDPDDFPISLFFKWQNSNLKGTGRTIGAGITASTNDQNIDFSYGQNWFGDTPLQLNETLSFFHSNSSFLVSNWLSEGILDDDYCYAKYESWGGSLQSAVGYRWGFPFAIMTVAGGMTNTITDNIYDENTYVPVDSGVNKYANRVGLKDSLFASISLDNRDVNYDPSKGWFASERLAWYGLIPVAEHEFYLKSDTKLEAYWQIFDIPVANGFWHFKAVLAAYTGITLAFPVPGTIFGRSSKCYIDGMFNGRGWNDIYNDVRGKAMLSNKIELRIPLFQGVIGIDCFFDSVAIKEEAGDLFTDLHLNDFYFSFGPGIRFLVPQFPLHLMFANKFRVIDGEVEWDDTWQFVLSFNMTNK